MVRYSNPAGNQVLARNLMPGRILGCCVLERKKYAGRESCTGRNFIKRSSITNASGGNPVLAGNLAIGGYNVQDLYFFAG